jgi:regulatory protein
MDTKIYDVNRCNFLIRNYCAKMDRCQKQVMDKLLVYGLSKTVAEDILIELIQDNYVNEQRFAESYCSGKFVIKKWGRKKISFELLKLKVSKQCIQQGLEVIDDDRYIATLHDLMLKKYQLARDKNQYVRKKKVANYVIRKGYESELVWDYIHQL